jgi:hypothetical protein
MVDLPDDFDWDSGNREKSQKHGVSIADIEAFFAGAPRNSFGRGGALKLPSAGITRPRHVRCLYNPLATRSATDPSD